MPWSNMARLSGKLSWKRGKWLHVRGLFELLSLVVLRFFAHTLLLTLLTMASCSGKRNPRKRTFAEEGKWLVLLCSFVCCQFPSERSCKPSEVSCVVSLFAEWFLFGKKRERNGKKFICNFRCVFAFLKFTVGAIWPVTGKGVENTKWPAVYSQYILSKLHKIEKKENL